VKKTIPVLIFFLLSALVAYAGEYRVIYLKGDINIMFSGSQDPAAVTRGESIKAGDSVETKEGSRLVLLYSGGSEIRADNACGITINDSAKTLNLKLKPGSYFINAPYSEGKKHEIEYEGGRLVFNRGIVQIKGKKAFFYSGRPLPDSSKNAVNIAFPDKPDEWQVFNAYRDRRKVCLGIEAPEEYRQYYFDEIKKGALSLYPVLGVEMGEQEQGCGVNCYVRVTGTAEQLITTVSFNRFFGKKAKLTEIASPIQKALGPNARLIAGSMGIMGVLRALEIELDAASVQDFIEGLDVTVEAEVKDDSYAEKLLGIIKSVRGVEKAEMKILYGQKAIIRVKIMGTGAEIAEVLSFKKSENPSINVWHFDRDIVKLKFM